MKNDTISTILAAGYAYDVMSLWYDWFCRKALLRAKGDRLLEKLGEIAESTKFDNDKCYVFFKNNCPCVGSLYDDFRICDKETGDVLYCVIPRSGHKCDKGHAQVYGVDNDWSEPLVDGSWRKVVAWFLS
jgi:hypothetical protein